MAPRKRPRRSMENSQPMAPNANTTAGKYTCQCAFLASPACTSSAGTATHMAICTVCSTNTPKFRRSSPGWRHTCVQWSLGPRALRAGSGGTSHSTTAMPASVSPPVMANKPASPTAALSNGASTSARANTRPMLMPTSAMALVRTLSRVWSASSAVTAADTAPAPCSARAMIRPCTSVASAAHRQPAANVSNPNTITRLRPKRSDAMPSGNCSSACTRPYTPSASPTRAGSSPPG